MDLSKAEAVLIDLLRGEVCTDFVLNVAWLGPMWTVSLSSEGDGVLAGRGDTFCTALLAAFGVEGDHGDGETAPAVRALKLVAGIDHRSERKVAA